MMLTAVVPTNRTAVPWRAVTDRVGSGPRFVSIINFMPKNDTAECQNPTTFADCM